MIFYNQFFNLSPYQIFTSLKQLLFSKIIFNLDLLIDKKKFLLM